MSRHFANYRSRLPSHLLTFGSILTAVDPSSATRQPTSAAAQAPRPVEQKAAMTSPTAAAGCADAASGTSSPSCIDSTARTTSNRGKAKSRPGRSTLQSTRPFRSPVRTRRAQTRFPKLPQGVGHIGGISVRSNSRRCRSSEDFPAPATPHQARTGTGSPLGVSRIARSCSFWSVRIREVLRSPARHRRVEPYAWTATPPRVVCHHNFAAAPAATSPPARFRKPPPSNGRTPDLFSQTCVLTRLNWESAFSGR